jgi:hypothetical protein
VVIDFSEAQIFIRHVAQSLQAQRDGSVSRSHRFQQLFDIVFVHEA